MKLFIVCESYYHDNCVIYGIYTEEVDAKARVLQVQEREPDGEGVGIEEVWADVPLQISI